jgi:hypothetical protein
MTKLRHTTGDDFAGSNFLSEPGIYHLVVKEIDSPVLKRDGSLDGDAIFRVQTEVLAGSAVGQEGKQWSKAYYYPKADASEQGIALKQKQQDRFWLAVNVLKEDQKNADVEIDTEDAIGAQFIVKLEPAKDPKYMDIANYGLDIFHVDDPAVATAPKDKAALARINPAKRRIGAKPMPTPSEPPASKGQDSNGPPKSLSPPAPAGRNFSHL